MHVFNLVFFLFRANQTHKIPEHANLGTMAPLPEPGQHHGCTDEQDQENMNNSLNARNLNSLQYLYRPPGQPNNPEILRSRHGTHPFSATEQDNFLADTLLAAWQLALESQAHFNDDLANHTITTTTTTTTTTTGATTTSGRYYIHNSTDFSNLDNHEDSRDNSTDLDPHEDIGDILPMP